MKRIAILAFVATIAASGTAVAASTVFGSSSGNACYQAARDGRTDNRALADCDAALNGAALMDQRDQAATLVNRGVIRLKRRESAAALADFDRALIVRPSLGEAHVNRGAALILSGDFTGAIAAIDRGLELGAEDPHEAYFNRALAWEKLDNIANAYRDYRKAQSLAPDWALPTQELARFTVTSAR
jgi:tetratricopeptide (TPR) repeat protein